MKASAERANGTARATRSFPAPRVADALGYAYAATETALRRLNVRRRGVRRPRPVDIHVPAGYAVDIIAKGLSGSVHCCFDDSGRCYVSESGYKVDSPPRIVRIDVSTGERETFFEIPGREWLRTGALTGSCWYEGSLYYSYNDHIGRIAADGSRTKIVRGLPGLGDHQPSPPIVGPDRKLYFTTGSATNCGVVGPDNYAYEWLRNDKLRDVAEVPGAGIELVGRNYESRDVTGSLQDTVTTGAFVPFAKPTRPGQRIKGRVKCTTGVLRCELDGSELELVAWGLRNAFGIRFHPDGRLFVTEHGIDERGARFIIGDFDDFYEVEAGRWYGFPDYASGVRLDDASWGDGGRGREPVIARPPEEQPPRPFVRFPPHAAANGFDFCSDQRFGFAGDAFVALFGDAAPVTTRRMVPAGFKVVRVDMERRRIVDFAVNRIAGGASALPHEGFERPSYCTFGPDGHLYVVDWGEMVAAPERGGVEIRMGTGALWRIRRTHGPRGERPKESIVLPVNLLRLLVPVGAGAVAAAGGLVVWRMRRRASPRL